MRKYINIYQCQACGYLSYSYLSIKNHIFFLHPEVLANYKDYITLAFKIPSYEFERRRLLYVVSKRFKKRFKKPKQSLRLVF